jgi:hypothetical protein
LRVLAARSTRRAEEPPKSPKDLPIARHPLSRGAAYLLAAGTIGLALFASGTPSPLYGTYSELWGFDSIVLTLVYATYAFGVLLSCCWRDGSPTRSAAARS